MSTPSTPATTATTATTATPATDPGPSPLRVFLLDDHEVVRRGIRHLLEATPDIEVVGEAATAAEALIRIPELRPDVSVLDVRLSDGSGIEVCRELRSRDPATRCVMLTSYDDDDALFAALMAGAAGYMLKEIDGASLIASLRTAAAGKSVIDSAAAARVLKRIKQTDSPEAPAELAHLSKTERKILALIAEGLTNRQIGERVFLAEKTVKNHVTSILAKLGLSRRTQAAVLATRVL